MAKSKAKKTEILKSKKHINASKGVDAEKLYSLEEALELVKTTSYSKFDGTVEAHFNLDIDKSNPEQNIRTTVSLPHGTGKTVRVAVFSTANVKGADFSLAEADIDKVLQGKLKPKTDFDVVAAEPSFMPKLTKIAKILGPVGMMPNPKTGTVSDNLEKVVTELKKGKIELRIEANAPIIHTKIGKVSFDTKQLKENFLEILKVLKANKPPKTSLNWITSCTLSATMGPGIKVALEL